MNWIVSEILDVCTSHFVIEKDVKALSLQKIANLNFWQAKMQRSELFWSVCWQIFWNFESSEIFVRSVFLVHLYNHRSYSYNFPRYLNFGRNLMISFFLNSLFKKEQNQLECITCNCKFCFFGKVLRIEAKKATATIMNRKQNRPPLKIKKLFLNQLLNVLGWTGKN